MMDGLGLLGDGPKPKIYSQLSQVRGLAQVSWLFS